MKRSETFSSQSTIPMASYAPKRVRTELAPKRTTRRKKAYAPVKLGRTPFPKRLANTVRYAEAISVTLSGGIGQYLFSCNGLYDPNTTGAGGQPLYFDQLTAIYDHYTVTASRCRFIFNSTSAMTLRVGAYVDDDSSATTGAVLAAGRPGGKFVSIQTPYHGRNELSLSWNQKSAFGPGSESEPNLQGSSSANPQEQQHFVINFTDPGGSANTVDLFVVIEYDTIWNELATIGAS